MDIFRSPATTDRRQGKAVVGIAPPEAPAIKIKGGGDVTLLDLRQAGLEFEIEGSGDIEAHVRSDVYARVAGSGDIVVHGNPPHRDHGVAGSGKITFR